MQTRNIGRILRAALLAALLLALVPARAEAETPRPVQAVLTRDDLAVLWSDGRVAVTGHDPAVSAAAGWRDGKTLCADSATLLALDSRGELCGELVGTYPEAAAWSGLASVSATGTHLVALKQDGTVLCAGPAWFGTRESFSFSDWKNVKELRVGRSGAGEYAAALLKDGGVRFELPAESGSAETKNTAAISCSGYLLLCLHKDGTVAAYGQDAAALGGQIEAWTGVMQVCAGDSFAAALKKDGTVLAASTWDTELTEALSAWQDIRALYLGADGVVLGVTGDGRVRVEPKDRTGFAAAAVEGWQDVERILCADGERVAAVSKDGQLLTAGTAVPGAADYPLPATVTDSLGCRVENELQSYGILTAGGPAVRSDAEGRITQLLYRNERGQRGVFTWNYDARGRLSEYRMDSYSPESGAEPEITHVLTLTRAAGGGLTVDALRRFRAGGDLEKRRCSFDSAGRFVTLTDWVRLLPGPGEEEKSDELVYAFAYDAGGGVTRMTVTKNGAPFLEGEACLDYGCLQGGAPTLSRILQSW